MHRRGWKKRVGGGWWREREASILIKVRNPREQRRRFSPFGYQHHSGTMSKITGIILRFAYMASSYQIPSIVMKAGQMWRNSTPHPPPHLLPTRNTTPSTPARNWTVPFLTPKGVCFHHSRNISMFIFSAMKLAKSELLFIVKLLLNNKSFCLLFVNILISPKDFRTLCWVLL